MTSAFSPASTLQGGFGLQGQSRSHEDNLTRIHSSATATSSVDEGKVAVKTEVPVSRISVCAGELCQCQGEQYEYTGGAADAAIEELQSLDLPFPVDEVGCMGACGMGTMIAIDFENGDSIMTDGLDSTLLELGIERQQQLTAVSASTITDINEYANEDAISGNEEAVVSNDDVVVSMSTTIKEEETIAKPTIKTNKVQQETKKPRELADVRDRMRQEAAEEVENPWINMASYLAKKATEKMFGSN